MKILSAMFFLMFLMPTFVFAQVTTKLVPITHIYVPSGFDNNDSSEIIISGYLPDSCYKAPTSQFVINGNKIFVTVSAIHVSGIICADIVVPFIETVRLGALKAQKYSIVVNNDVPQ